MTTITSSPDKYADITRGNADTQQADCSSATPSHGQRLVSSSVPYTPEEMTQRFEQMLHSLELRHEIKALGCGLDSFFKRKRSETEFTAMTIALWRLALERSFPDSYTVFFQYFISHAGSLGRSPAIREKLKQRINIYNDLFNYKKTADFTPVSYYMAELLSNDKENQKTLHLKLSLTIRRLYQIIFDHLI